jgi:hypothetical protein
MVTLADNFHKHCVLRIVQFFSTVRCIGHYIAAFSDKGDIRTKV